MTLSETDTMKLLVRHLRDHADRCRADAIAAESVYYKHHLLGRASAFEDCVYMIMMRYPEVNE